MKCSICKNEIEKLKDPKTGNVCWDSGNSSEPISEGRCCNKCDDEVVLPARLLSWRRQDEINKSF